MLHREIKVKKFERVKTLSFFFKKYLFVTNYAGMF